MKILQLTAHFRPNIGGVETHLDDLVEVLIKRGFDVDVLTYQPLTTDVFWRGVEKNKNIMVIRIPWITGLFYKLVSFPILEFFYLLPGLFFITPLILIWKNSDVIHAHGLVAGFVGVFWGKIFNKRTVVSMHSIYSFPKKGFYREFAGWIFKNANFCLGLSKQAAAEIRSLGVPVSKIGDFIYWIDLEKFKRVEDAKSQLGWKDKFTVLFVGRLVKEKGVLELLESVQEWDRSINLKIIGSGPLEGEVKKAASGYRNIELIGVIDQDKLSLYYSGSDILIVPSVSEEGFGRVILESLACGTPVIGANRGAISEAMDESVGKLIDVSAEKIKDAVLYFYKNSDRLKKIAGNCRKFAERRYPEKNVEAIIKTYQA
ncbi:hypothetical protein A3H81_01700 [Candidatus Daviesbacteria bacterium RIFCSPLOWO2_02_FULL_38_18]|nr:MAG: hypothetical protein A2772_00190 [Candidatus Daviesbacteria bacterium RIFCSPHIGHO2_01_FULL_38_8b]OGE67944.1 MAG: hypothetical protein A3H81_01700 [Candidatus Daviesbacteria bacterium RIFCSPLOWO2_02_FULL_38_18]OGE73357.1 MAG: hypothetical protein A3H18_04840 [Candidatus Daviesbacteria bacterium RIFCSPLOWO2_12_FULL_38_10]